MNGIIILGMYHSGTTFLAKCLKDAGVKMCSEEFMVADQGQHWECKELLEINKAESINNPIRVSRQNGEPIWSNKGRSEYINKLLTYRRKREADGVLWGAKEPLCALYSEAVLRVFHDCKLIICCRNPIRVGKTRITRFPGHTRPFDVQMTYSKIYANVLWSYHSLAKQGLKLSPLYTWNYDASQAEHMKQSESLDKYLGVKLDYMKDWVEHD